MFGIRARTPALANSRPVVARPSHRTVIAHAEGGFDVDKFVEGLPAPVEYCYAGAAWGTRRRFSRPYMCSVMEIAVSNCSGYVESTKH